MANSEAETTPHSHTVDFTDTKIAFADKTDRELKWTAWLFRMMNKQWFVKSSSAVALSLNEAGINIFNPLIKSTIYRQFCGGTNLNECRKVAEYLLRNNTYTVLDYGVEGKTKDEEFDHTVQEIVKAIENFLGKPAKYNPVEKGSRFEIDVEPIERVITSLGIHFTKDYLPYLLQKYYKGK